MVEYKMTCHDFEKAGRDAGLLLGISHLCRDA